MFYDGVKLTSTSQLSGAVIEQGTSFPSSPTPGHLFYLTAQYTHPVLLDVFDLGLYMWDGATWLGGDITEVNTGYGLLGGGKSGALTLSIDTSVIATTASTADVTIFTAHLNDDTRHLTVAENSWIDAITASSTEVNYLSGLTSNVQTQLGTLSSTLTNHAASTSLHLTPSQNTWIDAITASDVEVNYLVGVTSGIQNQFNTITSATSSHFTDQTIHLTSAQNIWIDSITVSSTEINYLTGATSNIQTQLNNKQQLDAELTALADLTTYGLITLTAAGTAVTRTITGSAGNIVVTNGSGIASDPIINLATVVAAGTYPKVTFDVYGRITSGSGLSSTDIPSLDWTKITSGKPTTLAGYGITDASSSTGLSTHISDYALHLTSSQNTWIDAITASDVEVNYLVGVTSGIQTQLNNKQPLDTTLTALAAITGTGILVETGVDTFTQRTLTGTANRIVVSAGDGVTGNPTVDLATVGTAGTYKSVTTDAYGRVTVGTNPSSLAGYGITDALALSGGTLIGMLTLSADPVNPMHAATRQYVDAAVTGLSWKNAAAAATTANITLSGTQTIDGYAALIGDRILVKNQTNGIENGIYVVSAGAWSRSTDADTGIELDHATIFVEHGTTQGTTGWTVNNTSTPVLGTDIISLIQFNGASNINAGNGITKSGNVISVNPIINQLTTSVSGVGLATTGTAGTYNTVTTDAYGRVTGGSNSAYLTGNQTITATGDVTGSGATSIALTLASVNGNVGTFGDTTHIGTFTVNAKGLITSAVNTSIVFPVTAINGNTGSITAAQISAAATTGYGYTPLQSVSWSTPGAIGTTTANTGAFTTLSASGQLTSTVASGTAPLVISSTTLVGNLNADLHDGYQTSTTAVANTIPVYNGSAQLVGSITGSAVTATNWGTYGAVPTAGTSGATANSIPRSDASGYTYFGYINSSTTNAENPTISQVIVTNGTDNFYRKSTIAAFTTALTGTAASLTAGTVTTLNSTQIFSAINGAYNTDWYRTTGATGWFNNTYNCGITANATQVVSTYNTIGFNVLGYIVASGDITAFSDKRLKQNIVPINNALDKVLRLNGVEFDRKDTGKHSVGVIAQEVRDVFPDLVQTNEDGMLSVAYGNLVGPLIEAIKELTAKVNELQAELSDLKTQNQKL